MIGALLRSIATRMRHPGLRLLTLETLRDAPRHATTPAIRALCASVAMNDGMALCRILGRYKIFVDTADHGLSPHLLLDGFWEMWVTSAILATLREGMVAIDVGANLGYFTLLLADIVGPTGWVHAFEPNPRMMSLLERSVAVNGFADRVTRHTAPLGAVSGEPVRLIVPAGEPKNAHLAHAPLGPQAPGAPGLDLRTAALDDILGNQRVDFIKIDAEGAERDIWRGMQRIVARGERLTVFLEFTAERYDSPDGFLAAFASAGFRIARIDERDGLVAVTAREVVQAPRHVDQMLALIR